jgi:hypothetical protein
MACEAKPSVFTYSMRVEWLGLDGQTQINNSMRVEWKGVDFSDRRAVCEVEETTSVVGEGRVLSSTPLSDSFAHTARCFLHLLVLAALICVLGRGAGFRVLRVPLGPHSWEVDPVICDWRAIDPPSTPNVRPRLSVSVGAVLEGRVERDRKLVHDRRLIEIVEVAAV